MNDEMLARIPDMLIDELWREFNLIKFEGRIDEDTYYKAKYGVRIKLDIRLYIEHKRGSEQVIHYDYKNLKYIIQGRLSYQYSDFLDEFEERENIMKHELMEYYSKDEGHVKDMDETEEEHATGKEQEQKRS